ncbi:hypothetical protein [Rivibacter subsaxonicus]|nr:hypothetical protein [Rivibacter subsaxonicus]
MGSNPFARVTEIDTLAQRNVAKLRLVRPFPSVLNCIASDAVHNLRSSLDQAGYAVSVAHGGKGMDTYFPFGASLADVRGKQKGGSAEIPQEIFDVMVGFKPYKGGNDLLWALNKLSNTNKHRITSPTAIATAGIQFNMLGGNPGMLSIPNPKWDHTKNEMELARYAIGGTLDFTFGYTYCISLLDVGPVIGQPAVDVLNHLAQEVESILNAIEAEAKRIGLFK